jgi:glycosyltransferase involved in cell wall biosynthesis
MALERRLERFTDGLIFESAYSAGRYNDQVGAPRARALVIPNGVGPADFQPIAPRPDAADFVFVGELRLLKGVDVLIDALACLDAALAATAVIVGDGPDAARFRQQAAAAGLAGQVRFAGAMPAREAFSQGRMLVMPSRAESFPYVVLEAGAAGLPLIATDVGGIPEITAGTPVRLLPPDDPLALAAAMRAALAAPAELDASAAALRTRIAARFTVEAMTDAVLGFYDSATAG